MIKNTQQTRYYDRRATADASSFASVGDGGHRAIRAAYTVYGLTAPSTAPDTAKALKADLDAVKDTTGRLISDVLEPGTDFKTWHATAVAELRDAIARQELAKAFSIQSTTLLTQSAPHYREIAARDLAKHIAKTINTLLQSAELLPAGESALDPEAVIDLDVGKHLSVVRDALATLGVLASMVPVRALTGVPPALTTMAPIVAFPRPKIELIASGHTGSTEKTLNEQLLTETREIRAIGNQTRDHGIDLTLVSIARGEYPHTKLEFAVDAGVRERLATLKDAFTQRYAEDTNSTRRNIAVLSARSTPAL